MPWQDIYASKGIPAQWAYENVFTSLAVYNTKSLKPDRTLIKLLEGAGMTPSWTSGIIQDVI